MYILFRMIALVIGYAFGLIETGYILGKLKKIDIRNYGSGNYGATNASRTLGLGFGLLTFFVDCLKPVFAYLLTSAIFMSVSDADAYKIICMYAAAGAILGHIYPFYLNFKGGKGVSSLGGLAIIFVFGPPAHHAAWPTILIPILILILIVAVTGFVSLGSICASLVLVLMNLILGENGRLIFAAGSHYLKEWYIMLVVIVIIIIAKHAPNIKRLINKNENKLYFKKKGKDEK